MYFEIAAEYFSCINIYRIMKLNSHQFFKDKIASFQIEHNYLTRASSLEIVDLPFYRLSKSQRSFLYKGLTFWNRIPIDIRNIPDNPRLFKRRLRKHIFDRIWIIIILSDNSYSGPFGTFECTFIVLWLLSLWLGLRIHYILHI